MFGFKHRMLTIQIGVFRHRRFKLSQRFIGFRRVVDQQVYRHHGERLSRGEITGLVVGDSPVGLMVRTCGARHHGMKQWHELAQIARIR